MKKNFPTRTELEVMRPLLYGSKYGAQICSENKKVTLSGVYTFANRLLGKGLIEITGVDRNLPGMNRPKYGLTSFGVSVLTLALEYEFFGKKQKAMYDLEEMSKRENV